MGLRERAVNAFKALQGEAVVVPPIGSPEADPLFTRYTFQDAIVRLRNLEPKMQTEMLEAAHLMYKGNPIAKRNINIIAEYVIGDGVRFVAHDPRVQKVLDKHWFDPTNFWPIGQVDRARDLGLTGELVIPAYVNSQTGHVTLGHIDPALIETIVTDPLNKMKKHAVVLKRFPGDISAPHWAFQVIDVANTIPGRLTYGRLIGLAEDEAERNAWGVEFKKGDTSFLETPSSTIAGTRRLDVKWMGSCFFFTVNAPLSATRGWSDLLAEFDWINLHDQFLFAQVEKAINAGRWVMNVLLKGMNSQQQRKWLAEWKRNVQPGEWLTHNENVEFKIDAPDLKLQDSKELAGSLKNHILAGTGLPPMWFAETLGARASAPEMTEPTYRFLRTRQRIMAYVISNILRFQVDMAVIHGMLKQDARQTPGGAASIKSASFYLEMADLSPKDQRAMANATSAIAKALEIGIANKFVDTKRATTIFNRYLDMLALDTYKDEPSSTEVEPNPEFDISKIFTTEANSEFTRNGISTFVNIDPQIRNGMVAVTD